MLTFKLRYEECPEMGIMGFNILSDMVGEVMLPTDGRSLAHDIVEHLMIGAEIGGVASELEALGAIWFTRGQFGDFPNSIDSPYQVIAGDIVNMLEYLEHSELEYSSALEECDEIESLQLILDFAKGDRKIIDSFLPYMVKGYNKACDVFDCGMKANNLFNSVKDAIDRLDELYGDIDITLTIKDGQAYANMVLDEYDDEE